MKTHPHLEEALQRDIERIRSTVTKMGALTETALTSSVTALLKRNRQLAYSVILRDEYIDDLEMELDRLCLDFLARHQPVGRDLRLIFSTIQINRELERIGDYAESIARQVLVVSQLEQQPPHEKFIELSELAVHMLRDAVQSFTRQDADLAERTMAIEERANALRTSINLDLRDLTESGKLPRESFSPLLTVSRRLERVTDQAKNLCEEVLYMCTGQFAKHKGVEGFHILFVDMDNSCLSQMAEAIGKAQERERFVFTSAGIVPREVDPRAVEFMKGKGVDLSSFKSKSLEQLNEWQHSHVVICLSQQAREAVPPVPTKAIFFVWPIKDPARVKGPDEMDRGAFEEAYQSLDTQIKELVNAVGQPTQHPTNV